MKRYAMRKRLKKVIGYIHLWLGLAAGIVIFVSMLGASIFVWERELTDWYYKDLLFCDEVGTQQLPISQLHHNVVAAYPGIEFTFLDVENDPTRNFSWGSYQSAENPGWTWFSGIEHYVLVYVNPYTGEVVGQIDRKADWITMSRFLHQTLLLQYDIGEEIVGAATLIMIVMAISGLVLWWPKNRKVLSQRLKVRWKASFKRVNWDLHSVGGFYTYLLIFFFATTGLVWSYTWWSNGIYQLMGSDPSTVFESPDLPEIASGQHLRGMDIAFVDAVRRQPLWDRLYFGIPKAEAEEGRISAYIYYNDPDSWWSTSEEHQYNAETGHQYFERLHDDKQLGEKWRNSNYDLHVGSIYGLPTKIIACLSALFFAILPISGFLIWWGRKKKASFSKKVEVQPRRAAPAQKPVIRSKREEQDLMPADR
ncbi:MAG: PepSY-associated TM helix domain-containing protein [Bacteroidota bacterium]